MPAAARDAAAAAATLAVLRVVDLDGLRQQAVAATRAAARTRGGGPYGRIRSLIERGSGARERSADPVGYLRRWRERGTLAPAALPIRELISGALAALPPSARPGLASLADTETITADLITATNRAVAGPAGRFGAQVTSRVWPIIGLLQLIATAALVLGVVWLLAAYLTHGLTPTSTVDVPFLGAVPTPAVLIVGGLFGSFLLNRLLLAHAGRLGRKWTTQVSSGIGAEVQAAIASTALARVATWDAARRALWDAARDEPPGPPVVTGEATSTGRPIP